MKFLPILLALALTAAADDSRTRAKEHFERERAAATEALAQLPGEVRLYSHRGDCLLFLGRFREAVADFEKMIALDPSTDAPHWRLGIAYYFAGEFEKSSRQFAKYHDYDGHDRENGVWKFLADAKREGIEKARTEMLRYDAFDREPFPDLYDMFAGKKTSADVLAEVKRKGLDDDASVTFFAHYYVGLNEELLGRREAAREHLKIAVGKFADREEIGGPGYMWQVANLHLAALEAPAAKEQPKQ